MSWCDEHGTDGGCTECADEYWKKEMQQLEQENERLREALGCIRDSEEGARDMWEYAKEALKEADNE